LTVNILEKSASGIACPSRLMTFAGGPIPAQLARMRALPFSA
jgi:hypothetical protein